MRTDLPSFRYHAEPVASGSIRESAATCACCARSTGWIYTATFCTAQDVNGQFCPWCMADGSAAERFEGEFTDSYGLDGVSEETLEHVTRCTPGFHAWQDPRWLVHCNDVDEALPFLVSSLESGRGAAPVGLLSADNNPTVPRVVRLSPAG